MFQSFCARQARGDFRLADRNELWRLLVTITLRKARNTAKAQRRDRRDIDREQGSGTDAGCDSSWELNDDPPVPYSMEAALFEAALERRLDPLLRL